MPVSVRCDCGRAPQGGWAWQRRVIGRTMAWQADAAPGRHCAGTAPGFDGVIVVADGCLPAGVSRARRRLDRTTGRELGPYDPERRHGPPSCVLPGDSSETLLRWARNRIGSARVGFARVGAAERAGRARPPRG